MGFFDSIVSGVGNLVSGAANAAMSVAQVAFPQLAIATSLGNMLAQGLGGALQNAAQTLTQVAGMPKFIAGEVGDLVGKLLGCHLKPSDPCCDEHVHQQIGHSMQDFFKDFSNSIVKHTIDQMENKAKGGAQSWFEALAEALGKALDEQQQKVTDLSAQVGTLSDEGKKLGNAGVSLKADSEAGKQNAADVKANDSDKASTVTKLQAESQKMSFMMSAFDNVLKTLGESIGTMARK